MIDKLIYKFFGFKVSGESEYYFGYIRNDERGFTHVIDILHKESGKHLIQSYSIEDTTAEGSLCVGVDIRMLFLLWMKTIALRHKWNARKE